MKRKKHVALTLLEVMIVIVLIGIIGSVIGFNMKGSLDEGRAFKTEQGIQQITDILMLEVAKGHDMKDVVADKEISLANSGLVKDVGKFLKDGWGNPYEITHDGEQITITSKSLDAFKAKKQQKR